jgi:ABC-type branched-subunit amino acid transport system ATPase component/ABC-type branched-subunit amino acid transport system permease subunit
MSIDFSATSPATASADGPDPVSPSSPTGPAQGSSTQGSSTQGGSTQGVSTQGVRWHRAWSRLRLLSGPLAAVVVIGVLMSGAIPAYSQYTVGLAAVYALAVLSLSLLSSWTGIWSIGHPALLAIGAYGVSFGSSHGWSLEMSAVLVVTGCALIGGFLGFVGSRFSVLYVALLTLAFTLVCLEIINVWKDVTNGDQGVPVAPVRSLLGEVVPSSPEAIYITVGALGLCLAGAEAVRRSSIRMRLVAAKTHPLVARTIGIAPEAQSAIGFAVSAATAGLAGVLLGLMSGFVSPETFSLVLAVNLIAATVLGGTGSLIGAVLGGVFLAAAPSAAASLSIDQPYLVGALLILSLIFLPEGIVPAALARLDRWTGWTERLQRSEQRAHTATPPKPAEAFTADVRREADLATDGTLATVAGLGVRFGGLRAVQDVGLTLMPGEIVAIIGPNGAGKTTFVNALSGIAGGATVDGSIRFAGENLRKVRPTRRRSRGLGRTFQHAELFPELSVEENVLVVNRWTAAGDRRRTHQLLTSVGLAGVRNRRPTELSFGPQKRVDLARAVAESPRLLVLDEPFGGLDAEERSVLASHIRRLRDSGVCVVIIDHVLDDLFAVADRVVAFDFGQLIAEGVADTILHDPAVRSSYLGELDLEAPPVQAAGGDAVITLDSVCHHYGGVRALEDIDLAVARGSVLGVVGANGAGKSTLGRILHGSLKPTEGSRTSHARTSLVPEGRALFKTLSVRENLEVAAYASGIGRTAMRRRLAELTEWLPERVRTRMEVSAGSLSGGEQQLVAIARALMAEPEVLILDEPALGLSPVMVNEVFSQINALAREGITTVILDQSLNRALKTCSDVIVLRQGEAVARGSSSIDGFAAAAEEAYFGQPQSQETLVEESR